MFEFHGPITQWKVWVDLLDDLDVRTNVRHPSRSLNRCGRQRECSDRSCKNHGVTPSSVYVSSPRSASNRALIPSGKDAMCSPWPNGNPITIGTFNGANRSVST